jgi:hypothetical protein
MSAGQTFANTQVVGVQIQAAVRALLDQLPEERRTPVQAAILTAAVACDAALRAREDAGAEDPAPSDLLIFLRWNLYCGLAGYSMEATPDPFPFTDDLEGRLRRMGVDLVDE